MNNKINIIISYFNNGSNLYKKMTKDHLLVKLYKNIVDKRFGDKVQTSHNNVWYVHV